MAVHGVQTALAAGAPEHLADPKTQRSGNAVGRAGGDGDRIGEQQCIRIEDEAQLIIVP